MKVKVYHAINCEGEILKRIITPDILRKDADEIAYSKLKHWYPEYTSLIQLKYIGKEKMMPSKINI